MGLKSSAFLLSVLCFSSIALGQPVFDTVALTGGVVPGMDGATFSSLGRPVLSNTGAVAFYGQVDANAARGIWNGLPGDLGIVARDGSPAPGIDGATFGDFSDPILSPNGTIAFGAKLKSVGDVTPENDSGIWVGPPSALQLVVREGDSTPGVNSTFGGFFGDPTTVNDRSEVAFNTFVHDTPTTFLQGTWTAGPSGVELVALEDSLAPGTDNHFGFLATRLVVNASGSVGFGASLSDANSSENQGIWVGSAGSMDLLARDGQVAPGTEGAKFLSTRVPSINKTGNGAFLSFLDVESLVGHWGIWIGKPGALGLLVRDGDVAPGTDGNTFRPSPTSDVPLINANDVVAFTAFLTPDNDRGLWRGSPDDIDLIARTGIVAPGTGGQKFQVLDLFTINSNDDVAFTAHADDSKGLWVNVNGRNSLVVLEGQLFDVDPTEGVDLREIEEIHFEGGSGGQDGRRMSFNDRNTLVFQLDFTDGSSGIFTTTVPEPSTVLLVGICTVCLLWWRT